MKRRDMLRSLAVLPFMGISLAKAASTSSAKASSDFVPVFEDGKLMEGPWCKLTPAVFQDSSPGFGELVNAEDIFGHWEYRESTTEHPHREDLGAWVVPFTLTKKT